MRFFARAAVWTVLGAMLGVGGADAATWQPTAGTNFWSVPTNWDTAPPNAVGATAVFGATTAVNNVTVDGHYTVGSMTFSMTGNTANNDHRFLADIITPGSITFDNGGAGASITANGAAPPGPTEPNIDFEVGVPIVLADNLTVNANQTNNTSAAGSVNFVAPISGSGGLTKKGFGTMTFILGAGNVGAKTYTGPTEFEAGKIRLRNATAVPTMSSQVRIHDGAWIEPISSMTTLQLGAGTVYLNGDGATGSFTSPGGVIRPERSATSGAIITIPNNIVLESDSVLHLQTQNDTTLGSMTLSGVVSGPGGLHLTHVSHNEQIGSYILTSDNDYTGGTELRAGTLRLTGASADLGTGNVRVYSGRYLSDGVTEINGAASARLLIETGVTNAIADTATLRIGGGFTVGAAKSGYAELQSGVSETVGGLILGSTPQTLPGTYGSSTSGAMFQNDEFFSGSGVINLVLPAVDDADFDGDGDVDGADFLTWQRGLGLSGGAATQAAGNANNDTVIDGADLTVWRNQFAVPATPAVGAVPEPAAAVLALVAAAGVTAARRRRAAR